MAVISAYSKEAITGAFPEELASKKLIWREVNTDQDEHKHFVEDFQLVTKALVLVELRNGEVIRHKDLKQIWQLVGNKEGFIKYVRDETREFIGLN